MNEGNKLILGSTAMQMQKILHQLTNAVIMMLEQKGGKLNGSAAHCRHVL